MVDTVVSNTQFDENASSAERLANINNPYAIASQLYGFDFSRYMDGSYTYELGDMDEKQFLLDNLDYTRAVLAIAELSVPNAYARLFSELGENVEVVSAENLTDADIQRIVNFHHDGNDEWYRALTFGTSFEDMAQFATEIPAIGNWIGTETLNDYTFGFLGRVPPETDFQRAAYLMIETAYNGSQGRWLQDTVGVITDPVTLAAFAGGKLFQAGRTGAAGLRSMGDRADQVSNLVAMWGGGAAATYGTYLQAVNVLSPDDLPHGFHEYDFYAERQDNIEQSLGILQDIADRYEEVKNDPNYRDRLTSMGITDSYLLGIEERPGHPGTPGLLDEVRAGVMNGHFHALARLNELHEILYDGEEISIPRSVWEVRAALADAQELYAQVPLEYADTVFATHIDLAIPVGSAANIQAFFENAESQIEGSDDSYPIYDDLIKFNMMISEKLPHLQQLSYVRNLYETVMEQNNALDASNRIDIFVDEDGNNTTEIEFTDLNEDGILNHEDIALRLEAAERRILLGDYENPANSIDNDLAVLNHMADSLRAIVAANPQLEDPRITPPTVITPPDGTPDGAPSPDTDGTPEETPGGTGEETPREATPDDEILVGMQDLRDLERNRILLRGNIEAITARIAAFEEIERRIDAGLEQGDIEEEALLEIYTSYIKMRDANQSIDTLRSFLDRANASMAELEAITTEEQFDTEEERDAAQVKIQHVMQDLNDIYAYTNPGLTALEHGGRFIGWIEGDSFVGRALSGAGPLASGFHAAAGAAGGIWNAVTNDFQRWGVRTGNEDLVRLTYMAGGFGGSMMLLNTFWQTQGTSGMIVKLAVSVGVALFLSGRYGGEAMNELREQLGLSPEEAEELIALGAEVTRMLDVEGMTPEQVFTNPLIIQRANELGIRPEDILEQASEAEQEREREALTTEISATPATEEEPDSEETPEEPDTEEPVPIPDELTLASLSTGSSPVTSPPSAGIATSDEAFPPGGNVQVASIFHIPSEISVSDAATAPSNDNPAGNNLPAAIVVADRRAADRTLQQLVAQNTIMG